MNWRALLVSLSVVALVGCKSTALTVDASENVYDMRRDALEKAVAASLRADSWNVFESSAFYAQKLDTGARRFVLFFTFKDLRDKASFSLVAKSGHALNFFTIGILGRTGCDEASAAATKWLAAFREQHKSERVAPGQ